MHPGGREESETEAGARGETVPCPEEGAGPEPWTAIVAEAEKMV